MNSCIRSTGVRSKNVAISLENLSNLSSSISKCIWPLWFSPFTAWSLEISTRRLGFCHSNVGYRSVRKPFMATIWSGSFSSAWESLIRRLRLQFQRISFAVAITSLPFVTSINSQWNQSAWKRKKIKRKKARWFIRKEILKSKSIWTKRLISIWKLMSEYIFKNEQIRSKEWCDSRTLFRIFNLVSDINTVVIFALLPANTLLLAFTMFNVEHVIISFHTSFFAVFLNLFLVIFVISPKSVFRLPSTWSCLYGT